MPALLGHPTAPAKKDQTYEEVPHVRVLEAWWYTLNSLGACAKPKFFRVLIAGEVTPKYFGFAQARGI